MKILIVVWIFLWLIASIKNIIHMKIYFMYKEYNRLVGQCIESAPEDVFGVVHHQLQHGGVLLVLHQEVGGGTVTHLGQVTLQVSQGTKW